MSAATADRYGERQPSELVPYTGGSGFKYYKDTLIIRTGVVAGAAPVQPLTAAGSSQGYFIGVAANRVDLTAGLGASQAVLNVWKTGEFTFQANGTGVSGDIGLVAYALDDQTVGTSMAYGSLAVGEIIAIPTDSTYRVRIDNYTGVRAGASNVGINNI